MAERVNELAPLHPDKELQLAIERGDITQAEVNRVWAETRDLSAQTPFETRRAVVELRKCGSLNDSWPVFFTQMTQMMSEMQGALTRDDSKFAHLVAGTETVVRELQKVGPLASNLTDLKRQMQYLTDEVRQLRADRVQLKKPWWSRLFGKRETPAVEEAAADGELMDYEREAEQARKDSIGSAWAK